MAELEAEADGTEEEIDLEAVGHPRGTMTILVIYALLFALGWLGLYFNEFMSRGTPHP